MRDEKASAAAWLRAKVRHQERAFVFTTCLCVTF